MGGWEEGTFVGGDGQNSLLPLDSSSLDELRWHEGGCDSTTLATREFSADGVR